MSTAVCYSKTFIEVREVGMERPSLRRECSEPWSSRALHIEDEESGAGAQRVFPDTPSGFKGGLGLGGMLPDVIVVPPSPPCPPNPSDAQSSGTSTPVFSPQMPVAACEEKCGLLVVDSSPPGSPSQPLRTTPVRGPVESPAGVPFVPMEAPAMMPWGPAAALPPMPCPNLFEFGAANCPRIVMVPVPVPRIVMGAPFELPPMHAEMPQMQMPQMQPFELPPMHAETHADHATPPANTYEVPQTEMSCGAAAPQGLFLEARLPTGRVERSQRGALAGDSSAKVFVGGLGPMTTSERLLEYFKAYGPVSDAVVIADTLTKRSRGFGYVEFDGGIPQGLLEIQHVIDQRRCGVREYTYGEGRAAEARA